MFSFPSNALLNEIIKETSTKPNQFLKLKKNTKLFKKINREICNLLHC